MPRRRTLKAIHLASTLWFVLCIGFILAVALRQAGFHWWVIFSLSGYSVFLILLLITVYLFAIFRGVSRTQNIELEHPLTSTDYYIVFYAIAPFLGALAGCLATIGENRPIQFLAGVALGTFVTTFVVWVIVDPLVSSLEPVLIPTSRRHRTDRLAQARAERERKDKERQQLLADILTKEEAERHHWHQVLQPQAAKLAELLTADVNTFKKAQQQAVDIGVSAWQLGGVTCMRELHDMALAISRQKNQSGAITDFISFWWDGIGSWRSPRLVT